MKKTAYIFLLLFFGISAQAQNAADTICTGLDTSHFGLPHQEDVEYHWQVSGGQILGRQDSSLIAVQWNAFPGTREVLAYVTDALGCPGDTSRYSIHIKNPAFASGKAPTNVCRGNYVSVESALADNFVWGGGQTTPRLGFVAEEDTVITLIALNDPCPNDTVRYFIRVEDQPIAGMNYLEDTVIISSSKTVYYTGSPNPTTVEWWHNGRLVSNGRAIKIDFLNEGIHEIIQIVKQGNCVDTIRQFVYVEDVFKVFIPNAFTPNHDGVNDYFRFEGVGIQSFEAQIFNRWGERVFTWDNTTDVPGWDGTNSGQDSKIDAYIYKIWVVDMRGQSHFYQDQFSLIR